MQRRDFLRMATLGVIAIAAGRAEAHHGWGWATDEEFEISGVVESIRLGNPHGEVDIVVDGALWTIEVGQPWRNERAGLTAERLAKGTTILVHGHRSKKPDARLVKAERVVIAGKNYDLYPERES
ncbi:MAG: DUF6152 family protein [Alphaproteobacteria bacterium]